MTKGLRFGLGAAALLGLLTAAHATDPLSLVTNHGNVLAYTDGAVPGMPLFTTFGSQIGFPVLADDGTVLFLSNMAGPQITGANSRALFQGTTSADLSVVAQSADPAPGLPGLSLVNNAGNSGIGGDAVRISPDGRSLFASRLTNAAHNLPATSDTAIFGGFAGSLSLVAREGDAAPGTSGALFGDFIPVSAPTVITQYDGINRNGRVMFVVPLVGGDVNGTTNNLAVYTGTPGALTIAVRLGDTMLPGVTAAALSGSVQMAGDRIIYSLQLAGAGVTTANDESLWLYTPGSGNTLLLREGDPAPGTTGAVFSGGFSLPSSGMTSSGRFEFVTSLSGGDVTSANDQGIFIADTTGAVALLARKGAPAPGTTSVFRGFSPFFNQVTDAGVGAFQATLTGGTENPTNDNGIWRGTPGSLSLVARAGITQVQGSNGSMCQQIIANVTDFSDFGFVFPCDLVGPDVFPGHNSGAVVAWTPTKGLFLVFRQGQNLQVSPGVFRPQTQAGGLVQFGNSDGRALALTHTGTLAINVYLDPGVSAATVDLNCFPTTDYYLDADGDGYGDPTTELNLCAGQFPPPGYITRAGDCLDSDPTKTGATTETCNGIDDDCNGRIDDGVPHPTGPLTLTMSKSAGNVTMSWNAVPNAIQYDIISGDLGELRAAGGHYTNLTQASCYGNDVAGTSMTLPGSPTAGNGQFFLMRAVGCTGLGAYDEGVPSQHSTRDQEIGTSLYSCPN
ncbi:MAG TPA: putative metal-binding motif-containing protein [Candidatus Polarisedimenticolaceae bacterium]|nr:putative metal-binding motif-containing protein [Candidatus Polarisedimenticolaceae bacterium]